MRLQYIFHGQNKEPLPFHVKSNWMPPVQPSIARWSYLENVKTQLAAITVTKPKNNLSRNEVMALKDKWYISKSNSNDLLTEKRAIGGAVD